MKVTFLLSALSTCRGLLWRAGAIEILRRLLLLPREQCLFDIRTPCVKASDEILYKRRKKLLLYLNICLRRWRINENKKAHVNTPRTQCKYRSAFIISKKGNKEKMKISARNTPFWPHGRCCKYFPVRWCICVKYASHACIQFVFLLESFQLASALLYGP